MRNGNRMSSMIKYFFVYFAMMHASIAFGQEDVPVDGFKGEKIIYAISPVGRAEYNDLGEVVIDGKKFDCVTFRVQVMGFDDTERIYIDKQSRLPVRVERDVSTWLGRQYLVEQYDRKNFQLTIDKYKNKRKIKQYVIKKDGPIHSPVLLPFYLRTIGDLNIGWAIKARFPEEFVIRLESFDDVTTPTGKYKAYHFTSTPSKFEIWISKDDLHLPIKVKVLGGFGYTLVMKKHLLPRTLALKINETPRIYAAYSNSQ